MTLDIKTARRVYVCSRCGYVISPGGLYATSGKQKLCRECVKVELRKREEVAK